MNWIWVTAFEAKGIPFANFDDELSKISSSKLSIWTEIVYQRSADEIILSLPRVKAENLSRMHTLLSDVRCPLVSEEFPAVISQVVFSEVQFMPVTVKARGGDVRRFSFARPLIGKPCVDLTKTKIEYWVIPNEALGYTDHLVFKEDCLAGKHFVRDSYTDYVVVSDKLKDALMATGDKALRFERPEDLSMLDSGRAMH